MSMNNGIIERLKEKDRQIRAVLAAEIVKVKRRQFKEFGRLKDVVGGACLAVAAQDAEAESVLRGILAKAPIVEADRKLLRAKGWL